MTKDLIKYNLETLKLCSCEIVSFKVPSWENRSCKKIFTRNDFKCPIWVFGHYHSIYSHNKNFWNDPLPRASFSVPIFSKQIPDPRGVEGRIILPAWITPTWNSHLKRKKNCIDYLKDLYPFEVSPYMIDEICFSFAVLQMYSL